MEAWEQWMKEKVNFIWWLTKDLDQMKKSNKGKETPKGGSIWVDLGLSLGKKKQKRYDEDDDVREATTKKVIKKAKLNEIDGIKKICEDLEAKIKEVEDLFALQEFSKEAKAKIAIL